MTIAASECLMVAGSVSHTMRRAMEIAIAVATGAPKVMGEPIALRGEVLFIAPLDSPARIQRRLCRVLGAPPSWSDLSRMVVQHNRRSTASGRSGRHRGAA
jgi:hypothetical protein